MTDATQSKLSILLSEILLLVINWQELRDFGFLSVKTFLLAGIAAVGSLVFKNIFNYLYKKIIKKDG